MIEKALQYSLMITGIYIAFQQGNIFSVIRIKIANLFDKLFGGLVSRYVQKPLWDCLPCMASFWTIMIYFGVHGFSFLAIPFVVKLILIVSGINIIIDRLIE